MHLHNAEATYRQCELPCPLLHISLSHGCLAWAAYGHAAGGSGPVAAPVADGRWLSAAGECRSSRQHGDLRAEGWKAGQHDNDWGAPHGADNRTHAKCAGGWRWVAACGNGARQRLCLIMKETNRIVRRAATPEFGWLGAQHQRSAAAAPAAAERTVHHRASAYPLTLQPSSRHPLHLTRPHMAMSLGACPNAHACRRSPAGTGGQPTNPWQRSILLAHQAASANLHVVRHPSVEICVAAFVTVDPRSRCLRSPLRRCAGSPTASHTDSRTRTACYFRRVCLISPIHP